MTHNNKFSKKTKKYFEYFYIKVIQRFRQKSFEHNNVNLKYMFYKCKESKELVIVFSACTREGIKARYNYVRTLKKLNINKLFILDDFGIDKRGEYYLGEAPGFSVEKAVDKIIEKYALEYEKVYYVGSSKGGFAALNFGLKRNNSIIICGAPQFNLGNYLSEKSNIITYKGMRLNKKYVNYLNKKILNEIENKRENIKVYIHYSTEEHTYKEHIKDLIINLKKNNIALNEDIKNYNNHGDVSLYFPTYLLKTLMKEMK